MTAKSKPPRRTPKGTNGKAASRGSEQEAADGTAAGMIHRLLTHTWETGEWAFTAPQARTLDGIFYGLFVYFQELFHGLYESNRMLETVVHLLVTEGVISREAMKEQFETVLARDAVNGALDKSRQEAQKRLQRILRRRERERRKGV